MTNLISVNFSTSSRDDPTCMLPQFDLKLTFTMPFPVWCLPLSGVVVTQWCGSLVHGVDLDKLPLMCLCFSILNCEGEMTLLAACFPEALWWTAHTIIVEHFTWRKKQRIFMGKLYDLLSGITWWFREPCYCFLKNIYLENVSTSLNNHCFTVYNIKTSFITFAVINYYYYYYHWKNVKEDPQLWTE